MIGDITDVFERMDIKSRRRTQGMITMSKDKRKVIISTVYTEKAGWKNGERLDPFRSGETFLLKPSKAGVLTLKLQSSSSGIIYSTDYVLEVMAFSHSSTKFEGWVEDDRLFFKPVRED